MFYISTRNENIRKNPAEAILEGIAEDGGLYLPESFDYAKFPIEDLTKMTEIEISAKVLSLLFSGGSMFDGDEGKFLSAVTKAYKSKFENETRYETIISNL